MPLLRCQVGSKLGWKFGATGKCFVGADARGKAVKQGRAILANQTRGDEIEDAVARINRRQIRAPGKPKTKPPKRLPVWLYPFPAERNYELNLVDIVNIMEDIVDRMIIPHLQSLLDERNLVVPQAARSDDFADSIQRLAEAMELSINEIPVSEIGTAATAAGEVNVWNDKEWTKQKQAAFGVDIVQREPFLNSAINAFVKENVALIGSMKSDYMTSIEGIVQRGIRQGETISTITKEIQKKTKSEKAYAQFLARDQVGKLNGNLAELRQTNLGVKKYIWRNSQDRRVRTTHRNAPVGNGNKTFSWNNAPSDTGHPGEDFQCRCYAEPDLAAVFKDLNL